VCIKREKSSKLHREGKGEVREKKMKRRQRENEKRSEEGKRKRKVPRAAGWIRSVALPS